MDILENGYFWIGALARIFSIKWWLSRWTRRYFFGILPVFSDLLEHCLNLATFNVFFLKIWWFPFKKIPKKPFVGFPKAFFFLANLQNFAKKNTLVFMYYNMYVMHWRKNSNISRGHIWRASERGQALCFLKCPISFYHFSCETH